MSKRTLVFVGFPNSYGSSLIKYSTSEAWVTPYTYLRLVNKDSTSSFKLPSKIHTLTIL